MNLKSSIRPALAGVLPILIAALMSGCAHRPVVAYVSLQPGGRIPPYPIHTRASPAMEKPETKMTEIIVHPEQELQALDGIGGAFNEIGGEALATLPARQRDELLRNLFDPVSGAGFSYCRTPVGASDFAFDAYSYSSVSNDFAQEHFSIERDEKYLLPYLQAARRRNPALKLFASPWSPPGWMKLSGRMDNGEQTPQLNHLREEPEVYQAYALYFVKYLQAYAAAGVPVDRLAIQNETDIHTKYPSCWMEAEQMAKFIRDYLRPVFVRAGIKTEIWAGTFRAKQVNHALQFAEIPGALATVDGLGFQYSQAELIQKVHAVAPTTPCMHTEGACFNGSNTVAQAVTRFGEIAGYLNAGLRTFCYWNMVLNETGRSGWNWRQNALVTVNRQSGEITYNPDYAPVFLFSKYIRPGSCRVAVTANETVVAVKHGSNITVFVENTTGQSRTCRVNFGKQFHLVVLPARSVCAIRYP